MKNAKKFTNCIRFLNIRNNYHNNLAETEKCQFSAKK